MNKINLCLSQKLHVHGCTYSAFVFIPFFIQY
uniref:Uncharacterized protein n=1 Tax=Anguilla anguilla TaxID=7936 RepID=A0A0E9V5Y4_ANGAN